MVPNKGGERTSLSEIERCSLNERRVSGLVMIMMIWKCGIIRPWRPVVMQQSSRRQELSNGPGTRLIGPLMIGSPLMSARLG
jgi:hypothetical protein